MGEDPRFKATAYKGGPGGLPPGLGHGVQGGPGGLPPVLGHGVQGGVREVAPRFRPQRLEITHFVTISVMFCCFSCISPLIYPTLFPNRSRLDCWWF